MAWHRRCPPYKFDPDQISLAGQVAGMGADQRPCPPRPRPTLVQPPVFKDKQRFPHVLLPPLPARPEPLGVDPATTAVIVIDMQNAYASPGGYVDLAGFDITGAAQTITKIAKVLDVARGAGIPVVYLQNGWDPDYVEAGGPGSPNWHKSNALKTMRQRPDLAGTLLARGTWDYDIVDALQPQPGDIRVAKPRYSAFFNSQLDSILRARGIRTLVFVGIATNVCVDPRCATDSTSNTSASCSKMPRINWAKTSSSAPAFTTSRSFSVG
jgi:ureidoacrylate peracid hydrolase